MSGFAAVVLAGSRGGAADPVAAVEGTAHKALVEVGGRPMLERVLDALRAAGADRLLVVTDPALAAVWAAPADVETLPAAAGPSESVRAAVARAGTPVLVTTADHALLRSEWVTAFIAEAPPNADVAAAVAGEPAVTTAAPDTRRTWLAFAGERVSGCNLFWLATPAALGVVDLWRRVETERKRPLRLAALLGPGAILRYLTGRLTLDGAADRLGALAGCRAAVVRLPFGLAAIDVDKPADLVLVRRLHAQDVSAGRDGGRA